MLTAIRTPPTPVELDSLIRLLDDETPEVRERVAERIACCPCGDLSDWLCGRPARLSPEDLALLSDMLAPARRSALRHEWQVPSGGGAAMAGDWDRFEALLRALSDFLHDGVTLRQPLSDALDLLADEARDAECADESALIGRLFAAGRLTGNKDDYHDPDNTDLAWVIAEGRSNPIGLCVVLILVARRLDFDIEGVHFPGHFLCRIHKGGEPWIVDCFDRGRLHRQAELTGANPDLTRQQKRMIQAVADPGTILERMLNNLIVALHRAGRAEDCLLARELRKTLL